MLAGPVFASTTDGEALFKQKCAACHTIGGGKLVGPDLKGVTARRVHSWLVRWISVPDKMIAEGDSVATALLKEFNGVPMPNMGLSTADAEAVISYLKEASKGASAPKTSGALSQPTQDEIKLGQNLFQGNIRFVGGGPSCISCHNVHYGNVIGGGILARELTTVFSRMGAPGIRAILTSSPFPVMQAAFQEKAITDDEISALIGFLQHVDKESSFHQPREYGWAMFGTGAGGVGLMLAFFSVIGRRRKKRSVNQDIYDRQIKSE